MVDGQGLVLESLRRLSRREYDMLVGQGLFAGERVELVHGLVVTMTPQGAAHAHAVSQLTALLVPALQGRAVVRVQSPLAVSADSEPEPDVAVVPQGDYRRDHPSTALLVIEVAETSLHHDQHSKASLYASCGVPEYWLVNLVDRVVAVHTGGNGPHYRHTTRHLPGESLAPGAFPDVVVQVDDILP